MPGAHTHQNNQLQQLEEDGEQKNPETGEEGFRPEAGGLTYLFRGFICISHLQARGQLLKGRTGAIWCTSVRLRGQMPRSGMQGLNHTAIMMPAYFVLFRLVSLTEP